MRALLCALLAAGASVLPLVAASVDGLRLNWSVAGHGAKTVIFVHGWTCDSTSWASQVPVLSRKYRVVTLDLPGHGRSQAPPDGKFSMELFARAVESVRRSVGASKVVLVGHSMGTPVIRQYARDYPRRVAGLVLVDGLISLPPGAAPPPDDRTGSMGLKARENMIRGMFTPETPVPLQKQITAMMLRPSATTATGAMLATFAASNWTDDVMTMPVLGIYADKSQLANREYSKKIFPAFEYVEIAGTGHFLMMEKPAEFNKLLSAFVDRVSY
jgi:pimeloyl-ACP methyl ester carboxylesterase